ncbi:hypothetical protein, partial [Streptococcus pyogenes]|uniref:hypothetical protein n=1 Tax=Streptococcus pyogenes TaxID=1314 RepID=UPI000FEFBD82
EGSYMETEIYVNGQFIGKHLNGYQEFTYDISDVVTFGAENLLPVQTHSPATKSRVMVSYQAWLANAPPSTLA